MISGYYSWNRDTETVSRKLRERLKRNFKLLSFALSFYILLNICIIGFDQWMINLTYENIFKFIVLNWSTPVCGCGHIWYLLALLYDYILMYLVNKYNLYRTFYYICGIVLIAVYAFEVFILIKNLPIQEIYYRNFLFFGFPLMMMGNLIARIEGAIKNSIIGKTNVFLVTGVLGGYSII